VDVPASTRYGSTVVPGRTIRVDRALRLVRADFGCRHVGKLVHSVQIDLAIRTDRNPRTGTPLSGAFQPPVTVVVPVFDRAETIAACLDSLLRLAYPRDHLQIVAVDNGSTDASREIIRAVVDAHPLRVRMIQEAKRGPSAARNTGIRECTTEIVAFTDSDCVVDPGWLSALVGPLADPAIGATGGRILAFPNDGVIAQFGERVHDHQKAMEVLWPGYIITMNFAIRRDILAAVGFFDEAMLRCEDVDLALRIRAAGYPWQYVHEAGIYHRNRRTLRELAREGVLHGRFLAQHGPHLAALTADIGPRPAGAAPPALRRDYTRPLPLWAVGFLTGWFRAAKFVGRLGPHRGPVGRQSLDTK
jgi:GT2 family glycosyltransferase